ncbi:MAG: hypothetical protein ACLRSD_07390 [Oscillibacter sp.]
MAARCWSSTTSSSTASWSARPSRASPALQKPYQDASKVLSLQ